jgi:hypothetical protein
MNRLKDPVTKIHCLSGIMLQFMMHYSVKLFQEFVSVPAEDFETLTTSATCQGIFLGVHSSLAPVSSNLSSLSTSCFEPPASNDLVCLHYSSVNVLSVWSCNTLKFTLESSPFLAKPLFTYVLYINTHSSLYLICGALIHEIT